MGQRKKKKKAHSNNPLKSNKRKGSTLGHAQGRASTAIFFRHLLLPKNASLSFFLLYNQSSLLSPRHCSPSCNTPMGEGEKCFSCGIPWGCLLASQEVSVTLVVEVVHRVLVAARVASSPRRCRVCRRLPSSSARRRLRGGRG